jgi:5-methylcytosine-specific restriction endonuclease McrA
MPVANGKRSRGWRVSNSMRFEVFKRDGFKCMYCGASPPDCILNADHILPRNKGGQNIMENLVTACQSCNNGKGDVVLSEIVTFSSRQKKRYCFSKVGGGFEKR